jgi:hypothetical protein
MQPATTSEAIAAPQPPWTMQMQGMARTGNA